MTLPDDMVTEVLSYLPAKSVGRFRGVSRAWRTALSSEPFVELQRRRANKKGQLKLFFGTTADADTSGEEYYFYSWQPGGAVKKLTTNNFHRPTPLTRPLHGLVLIRCCTDHGYYICNPCTGAVLALPVTTLPMIYRSSPELPPYYPPAAYGFGYCPVAGEYKVVRIFNTDDDDYSPPLCEAFVLDTVLSCWRPTANQPPACIVDHHHPGVFLNGRLHFLRRDRDGRILAFEVSSETFDLVLPAPPYLDDAPIKMMELDGCLCICNGHKHCRGGTYYVWLLRNYYEEPKWELLCCVDPRVWKEAERVLLDSYMIAPLCMYNSGGNGEKKVVFGTSTGKVFALDIPSCATPEILFSADEVIGCDVEDHGDMVLGLFEESLVPVEHTMIEDMLE